MELKKILTSILLIISSLGAIAQLPNQELITPLPNYESCGFDYLHNERMQNDTAYARLTQEFNQITSQSGGINLSKASNTSYIIPLVVHVMETGGILTNITDQQIKNAVKGINDRFRKILGGLGNGNGVDIEVEFALAVQDPNGNCTNGIVRADMSTYSGYMSDGVIGSSSTGISDAALKAVSYWNSNDYYNVWLVSEIDNNNGGFGIQGYAYFASAHGLTFDGMVVLANNFKNPNSTTGTHELGHAFNLYHTFQGDNNGTSCPVNTNCSNDGDLCCDTPPHVRSSSNCLTNQTNTCTGGSNDDFVHNYMDYSSDACQDEFTGDQKTRVQSALTNQRSSYLESNGNLSLIPAAVANVDYIASMQFACSGSDIQFYDISSCIPNTFLDSTYWNNITFSWTFDNGTNTYSSSLQNPLMSLPSGSYDVTLSVTNSSGTSSLTRNNFIVIGATAGAGCTPTSLNEGNFAQTVNQVSFNSISNTTSTLTNVAYTDFTCSDNTIVAEGDTYQLDVSIRAGSSAGQVVQAYIDYDNDGLFETGELVLSGSTPVSTTNVVSVNVTIPSSAVTGSLLRMRVYGEAGALNANEINCGTDFFVGDVEDYGVYIQAACVTPSISISGFTNPSNCGNSDGSITVSGSGSGDVSWSGATNGTAAGVSLPYTITGLTSGSYSIQLGSGSCQSTTQTQSLIEPSTPNQPTISTNGTTALCNGTSVTLTSSYPNGNTWSTGQTTASITVTNPNNYLVTYTDGSGCTATSSAVNVISNPIPTAPTITPSGTIEICPGGSIDLSSSESSGNVWSNGATTQLISVSTSGTYTSNYTDGNGCTSASSAAIIIYVAPAGSGLPVTEGFNTFIPTDWAVENPDSDDTWEEASTQGNAPSGAPSIMMNNYSTNMTNNIDDLKVKPIDLAGLSSATLTFDVAYARYNSSFCDELNVLVSTDCGQTYTTIYTKSCATLATDPDETGFYTPQTWRNESIDLTNYTGNEKIDIIFRNISGYGQALYIDNVNIYGLIPCSNPDVPTLSGNQTICEGNSAALTVNSGALNDANDWKWYSGSCGGSLIGTGSSITVNPSATTSYFARGEGNCVTPGICENLTVTVNSNETKTDVISACNSYTWRNGTTYHSNNNTALFTVFGTASNGCDSTYNLNLTINNSSSGTETVSACQDYTWTANSTTYNSSGTYTATLIAANGCDSTATLNLTINSPSSGTDSQTTCNTFTWIDGITYTSSNSTATQTLQNAAGCDSIVTLNLTINSPSSGTETISACQDYTWTANSTTYNSSGTYTATLIAANGCDSTATLNLTINSPSSGTDSQTTCNTFTWIDGITYTSSNSTATQTLQNAAGCDSIVTLNLTINNVDVSTTQTDGTNLSANAAGGTYQWLDCDNGFTPIPGATGQNYTATVNGNYAVIITKNACSDTSDCININNVGLNENKEIDALKLYPNPTNGKVTLAISSLKEGQYTFELMDALGRIVSSKIILEKITVIDLTNYERGVYLIRVSDENRQSTLRVVRK